MSDAVNNELRDHLAKLIDENEVILFMKGTPEAPACGFSARAVAVLNQLGRRYAAVDILPDPRIRQELTAISEWPTIPQLFVEGELIGGSDIMMEMYESGELSETLGVDQPAEEEPEAVAPAPQPQGLQLENNLE
jgi:monothiol glutaredoxin